MRTKLIAGNWKMNLNRSESVALAAAVAEGAKAAAQCELAVFPSMLYVDAVRQVLKGSTVGWGPQNLYPEAPGAYTGEVAATMVVDLECKYVILGHSERRTLMGETDAVVNKKTLAALAAGLSPIVCVGELLAERQENRTKDVIRKQFEGSLAGVSAEQMKKVVIAYEPVWAIGTGLTASPEQAEEVHAELRKLIAQRYNDSLSQEVRILYGGSVKPSNAAELMSQPNVDGALVGGASLKAADFLGIAAGVKK